MRKHVLAVALSLAGGCASRGLGGDSLPGSWALSRDGATAAYTFAADEHFTFTGTGADTVRLSGAWFADGAKLTLSFDGGQTATVPYSIAGDQLTIVDDPATVRAGSHASAVYARQ